MTTGQASGSDQKERAVRFDQRRLGRMSGQVQAVVIINECVTTSSHDENAGPTSLAMSCWLEKLYEPFAGAPLTSQNLFLKLDFIDTCKA